MKQPIRSIATLSIVLFFTGSILTNMIPLTPDWQHDIGKIAIFVGIFSLIKIIKKPVIAESEKRIENINSITKPWL